MNESLPTSFLEHTKANLAIGANGAPTNKWRKHGPSISICSYLETCQTRIKIQRNVELTHAPNFNS